MGIYTGLFIDETITPTFISPTVTADPAGSMPGAGADTIDGGEGADTMDGGDGDDTYFVDNAGDTVSETVGAPLGGVDLVFSSVNFKLSCQHREPDADRSQSTSTAPATPSTT